MNEELQRVLKELHSITNKFGLTGEGVAGDLVHGYTVDVETAGGSFGGGVIPPPPTCLELGIMQINMDITGECSSGILAHDLHLSWNSAVLWDTECNFETSLNQIIGSLECVHSGNIVFGIFTNGKVTLHYSGGTLTAVMQVPQVLIDGFPATGTCLGCTFSFSDFNEVIASPPGTHTFSHTDNGVTLQYQITF